MKGLVSAALSDSWLVCVYVPHRSLPFLIELGHQDIFDESLQCMCGDVLSTDIECGGHERVNVFTEFSVFCFVPPHICSKIEHEVVSIAPALDIGTGVRRDVFSSAFIDVGMGDSHSSYSRHIDLQTFSDVHPECAQSSNFQSVQLSPFVSVDIVPWVAGEYRQCVEHIWVLDSSVSGMNVVDA